ncbi:hypothetical protein B0I35DRAFT_478804 [Stachybotrys elegans]|uniref:Uncharacterized protein n=1 Tax=Stachybotrys elegans TaxID=80388 RepID=A0A8K0SNR4_9HYPO|nr:hypothetical protein B0I35DRAFT_478804 [Stachybotrys elegans]
MLPEIQPRAEERHEPTGPNLGWLLGLSLGGAVLLVLAIGLLISWRIQLRRIRDAPGHGYALPNIEADRSHTKYRGLGSEYSGSRFSNHGSISAASSVQAPLPSHQVQDEEEERRGRPRERVWHDDAKDNDESNNNNNSDNNSKTPKETWFCRDSWFSKPPHPVNLAEQGLAEPDEKPTEVIVEPEIHILKRQNRTPLNPHLLVPTARTPGAAHDVTRARGRAPSHGHSHRQPSITDVDLQNVLRSIDERLQEGKSTNSTPNSSPTKRLRRSPRKGILGSAHGPVIIGLTPPSPVKPHGQQSLPIDGQAMAGSAATKYLTIKTSPEMEDSESVSCYSLVSEEDDRSVYSGNDQPIQHKRAASTHSNTSSTLSTLYSVSDVEDNRSQETLQLHDPFVTALTARASVMESTKKMAGPQSPKRLTPNLRISSMQAFVHHEEKIEWPMKKPAPELQQPLVENQVDGDETPRQPKQKPKVTFLLEEDGVAAAPQFSMAPPKMKATILKKSIYGDSDSEDTAQGSPSLEGRGGSPANTSPSASTFEVNDGTPEIRLPPPRSNGQDILNALLSERVTKRELPELSSEAYAEKNNFPTPLLPQPKTPQTPQSRVFPSLPLQRGPSVSSFASSCYPDDCEGGPSATMASWRPQQQPPSPTKEDSLGVAGTVAELRRMNSAVSTMSANSMTFAEGDASSQSPRRMSYHKRSSASSRHYLNLAGASPQRHSRADMARRSRPTVVVRMQGLQQQGKENQAPGAEDEESNILQETGSGANISRESTLVGRGKMEAWEEVKSMGSPNALGLYNVDEFGRVRPEKVR